MIQTSRPNAPAKPKKIFWERNEKALLWTGGIIASLTAGATVWSQIANAPVRATVPTPQMPSPNAYDYFVKAGNSLVNQDDIGNALNKPTPSGDEKRKPFTQAEKAALIAQNAEALQTLRAGFSYSYWNPPARSFSTLFPEYAKYRATARLLSVEGQVRSANGDEAGAVESGLDTIRLGTEVPRGGVLIADLVGIACEAIGRRPLWARAHRLEANASQAAARRLEDIEAKRFPFADTLQEEKWFGQASLLEMLNKRNTFQIANELGAYSSSSDNDDMAKRVSALSLGFRLSLYSKQRIYNNHSEYMDALMAQARLPYWDAKQMQAPPVPGDPLSQIMLPVFTQARFKDDSARMENQLLIAVFALQAYHKRHRDYPAALDALIGEKILMRVPMDPLAPGAAPVHYRRVSANKYLLYSVGPDGKDDGGKPIGGETTDEKRKHYIEADNIGDWVVGINTYNDDGQNSGLHIAPANGTSGPAGAPPPAP